METTGTHAGSMAAARRHPDGWTLASRTIVLIAILPLFAAVIGSFKSGEADYAWWWGTSRGWSILGHTLGFALLAAVVGAAAGWVLATAATRAPRPVAALLLGLACLPMLLPSSLLGTAWIMALGRDAWATNALRSVFGGWPWTIYRLPVAAAAVGLRYFGLAALILLPAIRRQRSSIATGRAFAIPSTAALLHLRLRPAIAPLLAAVALLTLLAANDHILPGMFLINTYGTQVLIRYNAMLDPAGAAALAIPVLFIALPPTLAAVWLGCETWTYASDAPPVRCATPRVGPWLVAALTLALALGVPAIALMSRAGPLPPAVRAAEAELWRTVQLSLIAGPITALLAIPPAVLWLRAQRLGERCFAAPLLLVNLIVPPSLPVIGIVELAQRPPLTVFCDTDLPLIFGYVCRFLPVAVLLLVFAWSRREPTLVDAERAHNLPPLHAFRSLTLPVRGPAFAAAAGLCALLVATELEASLMLTPPGVTTLGVRLYSLIHTAPDAVVSALALGVLLLVAVPVSVFAALAAIHLARRDRHHP